MKLNTKKGLKNAFLLSILLVLPIGLLDKFGHYSRSDGTWRPPISWTELLSRIPIYIAGMFVIFTVVFLWWIYFRREPKYCINCRKVLPKNIVDDTVCPICKNATEPLEGVFDRNPELKE